MSQAMEPSHRTSMPHRPTPDRSSTWPLVKTTATKTPPSHALPSVEKTQKAKAFEEHLDQYPGAHFLSPADMYDDDKYDDWSDDSDSDADEVEWDAGITDFALFDSDRRRAKATGQALPQKWNELLSSQASALGRSVERARSESSLPDHERTWKDDTVPDLTPDASPHLADDLDVSSYQGQSAPRPVVPNYLRPKSDRPATSSDPDSAILDDEDELTLAFFPRPEHRRARAKLAPQRPGLSGGSRTLSGRLHSWQRPSLDTHSVQEDVNAEQTAELAHGSAIRESS